MRPRKYELEEDDIICRGFRNLLDSRPWKVSYRRANGFIATYKCGYRNEKLPKTIFSVRTSKMFSNCDLSSVIPLLSMGVILVTPHLCDRLSCVAHTFPFLVRLSWLRATIQGSHWSRHGECGADAVRLHDMSRCDSATLCLFDFLTMRLVVVVLLKHQIWFPRTAISSVSLSLLFKRFTCLCKVTYVDCDILYVLLCANMTLWPNCSVTRSFLTYVTRRLS